MNQLVPHWSHANTLAFGSVRSARWRLLGDEADDEEDGELEALRDALLPNKVDNILEAATPPPDIVAPKSKLSRFGGRLPFSSADCEEEAPALPGDSNEDAKMEEIESSADWL